MSGIDSARCRGYSCLRHRVPRFPTAHSHHTHPTPPPLHQLLSSYYAGEVDRIELMYTSFISMINSVRRHPPPTPSHPHTPLATRPS